jgi:succinate-semialdehyde dehydrogenase/glutarate-semialdehyde dehydrogenase
MAYVTTNPATGQVDATFDFHTPSEVDERLELAHRAASLWRTTPIERRARHMSTAAELLEGEVPVIAEMLTREMGKTFAAAKGEVSKCAQAMRYYAEHGAAFLDDELIASSGSSSGIRYDPLGAILAVMPWNFPLWQVIRFAAPNLMAGNVGVLKHASNVPQAARFLEGLFLRAGFPLGCFVNLLIPSSRVDEVIRDERIAAVTLTGSEAAGKAVASTAGDVLKKCVLELGGSDAFVVAGSADLDRCVPKAVTARVQNNGQSCIASKRFIVVASRAEEFLDRFSTSMAELVVGDPLDPGTDVGPLVSASQREEVAGQVDDALAKGAVALTGGSLLGGDGFFYQPTVLTGVTTAMRAGAEEIFGPVAVVHAVPDLDAAIELANATPWGLGASIWAQDDAEQRQGIEQLDAGMVFVNAMVASTPELPFGGIKRSGYGRELAAIGMREFTNAKTFYVA